MVKLAKDIMTTNLSTVTPATPLEELARLFVEDEISGVPVVRVDGRLVGIVSRTDLLNHVLLDSRDHMREPSISRLLELGDQYGEGPGYLAEADAEGIREQLGCVEDIMQPEPTAVRPATPLHEIAKILTEQRIHRVLVTEGDDLLGIITSLDLLRHFPREG